MLFSTSIQRSGSTLADLLGHRLVGQRLQPLDDHLRLDRFFLQPVVDRRLQAEDRVDALLEAVDVPLLGIGARRAVRRRRSTPTVSARMSAMTSLTCSASMMSARCS